MITHTKPSHMYALKRTLQNAFYIPSSRIFLPVNNILAGITLISVLALILDTVPALEHYSLYFSIIEYGAVCIFTLEYIGRVISKGKDAMNYIFSFIGIIDLLAIVPTYLALGNITFLKTARIIRILLFLRIVRIAKLARGPNRDLTDIEHYADLYRLNVRIYFFALLSTIILCGSLIYIAEGEQNPVFESIPLSMVWAAKVAMGGVAQHMPQTALGDIITIITRFAGLALFGLLIHIIGTSVQTLLFGKPLSSSENAPHRKKKRIHTKHK